MPTLAFSASMQDSLVTVIISTDQFADLTGVTVINGLCLLAEDVKVGRKRKRYIALQMNNSLLAILRLIHQMSNK